MATQESINGITDTGTSRETNPPRNDAPDAAQHESVEREDWNSEEDGQEEDEAELEEILLPESMRESFAELAEAVRNVIRANPLAILAGAAGAAYVAGHRAARR